MISQLRRRHLTIWMILTVLLPIGFTVAILSIPSTATVHSLATTAPPALPTVVASRETPDLKFNRRTDAQARQQLEVIIKQPLTRASTLIYLAADAQAAGSKPGILLGRLGPKGVYRFAVPTGLSTNNHWQITLFDAVKGQTIQTIPFKR